MLWGKISYLFWEISITRCLPRGNKEEELRGPLATVSLGWRRCCGIARKPGMLLWTATASSGRTRLDREDKELFFMWDHSGNRQGWTMSQLRAYRSASAGQQMQVMLWWVSSIDLLPRKYVRKELHVVRSWSSWGTPTTHSLKTVYTGETKHGREVYRTDLTWPNQWVPVPPFSPLPELERIWPLSCWALQLPE